IAAPSLVTGATDSRYFSIVCPNIYRFCPMKMKKDDLARFHGTNERLAVENYLEIIRFYVRLIKNSEKAGN
ncbi:hypothetical protein HY256_02660, partial [Candidatus Sumerlaeota bacterium]|nr:hypothetical protein [Candidatus Sumerlaeota bacterium]